LSHTDKIRPGCDRKAPETAVYGRKLKKYQTAISPWPLAVGFVTDTGVHEGRSCEGTPTCRRSRQAPSASRTRHLPRTSPGGETRRDRSSTGAPTDRLCRRALPISPAAPELRWQLTPAGYAGSPPLSPKRRHLPHSRGRGTRKGLSCVATHTFRHVDPEAGPPPARTAFSSLIWKTAGRTP
jgi:hypothetical protein